MSSPVLPVRLLVPILLLTLAPAVPAAVMCADTGLQLHEALMSAMINGNDNEIRVTSGVKHRVPVGTSTVWWYVGDGFNDLTISGGWGPGCVSQSQDPRLTRLSGGTFGATLGILLYGSSSADITIRNLTLENGLARPNSEGAGLDVQVIDSATPLVLVERVIVRHNDEVAGAHNGAAVAIRLYNTSSGVYTLRNLLVEDNRTRGLWLKLRPNAVMHVNNSTFMGNNVAVENTETVEIEGTGGTVWLANNLMHANGGSIDLMLNPGPGTILRNNHLETLLGSPGSYQGMTVGDPMLAQDDDGWFRPRSGSPLCDSGHASVVGGVGSRDLSNAPRVQTRVDRGALESDCDPLFRNGFQLP